MPTILAFDIETVPDTAALRQQHNLPAELPDGEVIEMIQRLRRQEERSDFMPPYLHRIVAISCVLRRKEKHHEPLQIFSLPADGQNITDEAEAIRAFYGLIDKEQPVLVSWNGGGFDLPVLHYRAMKHRQQARGYWNTTGDFKWNSYLNRFHERHTDLMDVLSGYQQRAAAPLDGVAQLCGLPGKIGIGGGAVLAAWQAGQIADIRAYCEADALLTYLLYVRYEQFRGKAKNGEEEEAFVRRTLEKDSERWAQFLSAWRDSNSAGDDSDQAAAGQT